MRKNIVALEGLVHAGKTTLLKSLKKRRRFCCLSEYSEITTRSFPGSPRTIEDAKEALYYFLSLEKERIKFISESKYGIYVVDRSLYSVLAYHYAVEHLFGVKCYTNTFNYLLRNTSKWLRPSKCIFIDISHEDQLRRHEGDKGYYQDILLNADFNKELSYFYWYELGKLTDVIPIDEKQSRSDIVKQTLQILQQTYKVI